MLDIWTVGWLILAHLVGDFFLQSNNMALNKSRSLKWLLFHTVTYAICFLPFGFAFAALTFGLHTFTDYFTSKWTTKLWFISLPPINHEGYGRGDVIVWPVKRHWFFVAIGIDQAIHMVTLLWTLKLLQNV